MVATNITQDANRLSPLGFRLTLKRAPHVQFFCNKATLPSMTLATAIQATPFVNVPRPGNKVEFEQFSITTAVDNNMSNYKEIADWIVALGRPQNYNQFRELAKQSTIPGYQDFTKDSITSDASLIVLTGKHNGNVRINFEDIFPTSLSPLQFDTTNEQVQYIEAEITFAYKLFTIDVDPL